MPTKVAKTSDFREGEGKLFEANGKSIAVFKVKGKFYAVEEKCTHRGGPLHEGSLDGTTVTCPWHGSKFDIRTGKVMGGPATKDVPSYKVTVKGEDVLVDA